MTAGATGGWLDTVGRILSNGVEVAPRGMPTLELQHHTFVCDMNDPVVRSPSRALSYRFMAAEALWILSGDDTVAGIAPYNSHIAKFSDDGVAFFGAYGPRVIDQLGYVIKALVDDRDTRQAVLTTWRQNPPKTKDVPCTVAMTFMIRNNELNCHVFMRSSDAWLGLPYDAFNFSMIAAVVACDYNRQCPHGVQLGTLYLTAASSHLYKLNWLGAADCINDKDNATGRADLSLFHIVARAGHDEIKASLVACRDKLPSPPWRIRP